MTMSKAFYLIRIKFVFIFGFTLLLNSSLASAKASKANYSKQYCMISDFYDSGNYKKSSKLASKLIKKKNLSPLLKDLLGYIILDSDIESKNYKKLSQSLKRNKTRYSFINNKKTLAKAHLLKRYGKTDKKSAAKILKAVKVSNNNEERFDFLYYLYEKAKPCEGLNYFSKLIHYFPENTYVISRIEKQQRLLEKCSEKNEKHTVLRLNLVNRLYTKGYRDRAHDQMILLSEELNKKGYGATLKNRKNMVRYIDTLIRLKQIGNARTALKKYRWAFAGENSYLRRHMKIFFNEYDREGAQRVLEQIFFNSNQKNQWGLYVRSWLFLQRGLYRKAATSFKKYLDLFPRGSFTNESLWFRGYSLYRIKKFERAREVLASIPSESPLSLRAKYWTAVSYLWESRNSEAIIILKDIIKRNPLDFYAMMSHQRLISLEFPEIRNPIMDHRDSWANTDLNFDQGDWNPILKEIYEIKDCKNPVDLDLITKSVIRRERLIKSKDEDQNKKILSQLIKISSYPNAIRLAYKISPWSQEFSEISNKDQMLMAAFPSAYLKNVRTYSKLRELPSGLVLGIIREESAFNEDAVSLVGARGLMQIMPKTGKKISQIIGLESFDDEQLSSSRVSIKLGSWYIKQLMEKYNNKMAEAIASYNAGPMAVTNWLKSKELMMIDEFCEEIPYRETRRYVKKVMRSYYVYSILLDGKIDSIKIDTPIFMAKKWKQNINF